MKTLPRVIKVISYLLFFVFLCLFSLASLNQIRAQEEVKIPGPDLEDASFIPVKDLKVGDWVFVKGEGGLVAEQITKLEYKKESVEVYNLSVDGEQTFFANDFAVHNKIGEKPHLCEIYVTDLDQTPVEQWTYGNTGSYGGSFKNLFAITEAACCYGQCICLFGETPNTGCGGLGVSCQSGQNDIKMYTRSLGGDYKCTDEDGDCWDTIEVDAPDGWLIKDFEFDFILSVSGSKGRAWFKVDRRSLETLAQWKVCVRSGDCPLSDDYITEGDNRIQTHAKVNMAPATKRFTINTRVASTGAQSNGAVGRLRIYNLKLHMIKPGTVDSLNVDLIKDVVYYGYNCPTCNWSIVNNGGINDLFMYGEQLNIVSVQPPQTEGGSLRHRYDLTLSSLAGERIVKAKSDLTGDGQADPWCTTTAIFTPPAGTIIGNVYKDGDFGKCDLQDPLEEGWSVTCNDVEAEKTGPTSYKCCAQSSGGVCTDDQLPYGDYLIEVNPPPATQYQRSSCSLNEWSNGDGPFRQTVALSSSTAQADDLYLWQGASPWYQTKEGDVHTQGGGISSSIFPDDTYFSLANGNFPGLVSYNYSEPPSFGRSPVSEEEWLANDDYLITHRYDYFYSKLGSPTDPFDCSLSASDFNGLGGGFYLVDGDCVLNQSQALNVDAGEKFVIFISGSLRFSSSFKGLNVASGGFLAFVVQGDINISGQIGDKTSTILTGETAHLQGVYITDGVINTYFDKQDDIDKGQALGSGFRLVAAGIFIANEFKLDRNVKTDCSEGICNETTPSELFIARPDLFINIPEELKEAYFFEQEVAP